MVAGGLPPVLPLPSKRVLSDFMARVCRARFALAAAPCRLGFVMQLSRVELVLTRFCFSGFVICHARTRYTYAFGQRSMAGGLIAP